MTFFVKKTGGKNRFESEKERYRWWKLRLRILRREPLCRMCKANGIVTAAAELDHIIPISQGGSPFDEDNLQPLCRECHQAKTSSEYMNHANVDEQIRIMDELAEFDDWPDGVGESIERKAQAARLVQQYREKE